jgi:hypothetical protein
VSFLVPDVAVESPLIWDGSRFAINPELELLCGLRRRGRAAQLRKGSYFQSFLQPRAGRRKGNRPVRAALLAEGERRKS